MKNSQNRNNNDIKKIDIFWKFDKFYSQEMSEHEYEGDTNWKWHTRYSDQRIDDGTWGLGNKRRNENRLNKCILSIGKNTEKSPGDLRTLTVTQTPVKNHQLKLVKKTLKKVK